MKLQAWPAITRARNFAKVCETLVVNSHGGLLMLTHEVDNDEMLCW